jgi:GNAT superfamily N-acetyltransferase
MSSTERKWSIRPYKDGDEEGIFSLWRVVYPEHSYNRQQWIKWWQWKYKDNPSGVGVICVAEHDGRIVGHTAELPMMMKVGSETVLVGFSLDAMTHPDYRRQGTFVALVKARCTEGEKRGIRATYGFRNKSSYPYPALATRLGMFDGATMQKVFRPLDWRSALRTQTQNRLLLTIGPVAGNLLSATLLRPSKKPLPKGLSIAQATRFDARVDEFCRKISDRHQVIVLRNKEFLNWRYVAAPLGQYSIYIATRSEAVVGYLVLGRKQADQSKVGVIADVLADTEEVAQFLISKVVERCREEKLDFVWSARIAGTSLAHAYRRNGFIFVPFAKSIGIKGRSSSPSIARQMQNPKSWFLQMGDSDEA